MGCMPYSLVVYRCAHGNMAKSAIFGIFQLMLMLLLLLLFNATAIVENSTPALGNNAAK